MQMIRLHISSLCQKDFSIGRNGRNPRHMSLIDSKRVDSDDVMPIVDAGRRHGSIRIDERPIGEDAWIESLVKS